MFLTFCLFCESEDADPEEEDVEDDLCLLLFLDLCFLLDWSLLEICPEREACEVCLLSDLKLLSGGSMTTLG